MVRTLKDLTDQRFGRLTAICRIERPITAKYGTYWRCNCECGNIIVARADQLTHKIKVCCGCSHKPRAQTHGMAKTPEYKAWKAMKTRCFNEAFKSFEHYGGRGIKISERWLQSFENFYEDMGPRPTPTHSIDRINGNGNYEPENCRWATKSQQSYNRKCAKKVVFQGREMSLEAAIIESKTTLSGALIRHRMLTGWSADDALLRDKRGKKGKKQNEKVL